MAASSTVHLRITGRVQGVGYRAWAQKTARKLGLTGWVRNLTDGSVEALAQGPKETLDQFVAACQAGPMLARVTAVETKAITQAELFSGFEQRETADPS